MPSLGKPIPHDSAIGHVTGQAAFLDDILPLRNELVVGYVGSPIARGTIQSIDLADARKIPGIFAIFTAADLPGHNLFGPVFEDESILADKDVSYIGQPIVVIAAESAHALQRAKKSITIKTNEENPILSIDQALAAHSFIGPLRQIRRGDPDSVLASSPHTLSGTLVTGGQDHFYLESQVAIAHPGEEGQIVVHSSTQNPSEIQAVVARALKLQFNQVICICKRMGGGFGGKETQAALPAIFTSLTALKTRRPARIVLNKDDDMMHTGKRHPYQSTYTVGFDDAGRITALKVAFHSNGGCSADLSLAVMERTMLHADNAYFLPHCHITGQVCKTNLPSNTAFRGFGGPQGVAAIENILEEIAVHLHKDPLDIRIANLYGTTDRNITPYGQVFDNNLLPEIFTQLRRTSHYDQRRKSIALDNATSPTHLRGLAFTPVKFGISFTKKHLNQGNALLNVYLDGTVQVSTGGTEMGQGHNVKIKQLVADEFAIDPSHVLVMPTSTEKNNNTSPTAASASTDLNGSAAVHAARQIKDRLAAFAADIFVSKENGIELSPGHVIFHNGFVSDTRLPDKKIPFVELIQQAHLERVDLGARGFYATPGVDYNRDTGKGAPFLYYTTGAAVSEVLIDRFTGDLKLTRVDLLMDIGQSINPGVDHGQIIGGFVQGLGWVTTEQLVYSDKGALLSHSPTTYKIPGIHDIPDAFTLDLVPNPHNTRNVHGSKAVGEPPFLLAISVWAAVKNALSYVTPNIPKLDLPATAEQILLRLAESSHHDLNGRTQPSIPIFETATASPSPGSP